MLFALVLLNMETLTSWALINSLFSTNYLNLLLLFKFLNEHRQEETTALWLIRMSY